MDFIIWAIFIVWKYPPENWDNYGKSSIVIGKTSISIAIFQFAMSVYQYVYLYLCICVFSWAIFICVFVYWVGMSYNNSKLDDTL